MYMLWLNFILGLIVVNVAVVFLVWLCVIMIFENKREIKPRILIIISISQEKKIALQSFLYSWNKKKTLLHVALINILQERRINYFFGKTTLLVDPVQL